MVNADPRDPVSIDSGLARGGASGLAYYYFESKDAIVLAFYHRAQEEVDCTR